MNYTVENAEKSARKITINFDAKEWAEANDKAYLKNRKKYAVNGFRKGKVPKNVLLNVYGKGLFYDDALNGLFMEHYFEILDKEKDNFVVVGDPTPSVESLTDEKVTIVAIVPVKPEIEISAYKGMKIKKVEYTVSDEDVDGEVERFCERFSTSVDVTDRPAKLTDTVNIDFSGSVNGVVFDGGTAEKFDLTLGSGQFIEGFEDQVVGMNIGDKKDVNVTFPETYQAENLKGKAAVFAVTLNSIKGKVVPELTDEFIKEKTGSETVADYKAKVRERLEKNASLRAKDETENNILDEIAKNATCEIPDAMLESQIDQMVQRSSYTLQSQGITLDDYLSFTKMTMADFRAQFKDQAKKNVLNQLIIEKLIKTEGFTAEDSEVEEKIKEQAESVDKSVEDYKKTMEARQYDYIRNDIALTKLFNFLKDNNEMYIEEAESEKA